MLLTDTHVALWVLADDPRLGPASRAALADQGAALSSISVLEMVVKAGIGKLRLPDALVARLESQGFSPLPFTARHAEAVGGFEQLVRHDPFDRALLAQAASERLRFLTADRRLLELGLDWVDDAGR